MSHATDTLSRIFPDRPYRESGNAILVTTSERELYETIRALMREPLPLVTMFATDERRALGSFCIHYVFGLPAKGTKEGGARFVVVILPVVGGGSFPSFAKEFPVCAFYEREIATMFGIGLDGHPDPRSLILHEENWPAEMYPLRKDFAWDTRVPETHAGDYRFKVIGGEGIYEIPVGPVHAGIIEPGHFRFSVLGEEILQLEPRLGWVHKGTEKLFEGASIERATTLAEHVSGDSSFSHSLALCQALEALTKAAVPVRALFLRTIFAELERLTMHIFDVGNIAGNGTGFSFMAAQGFRIVESLRRLSAELSGHRFLRGMNVPGGVATDLTGESVAKLQLFLAGLCKDFSEVVSVANSSASLANRLNGTGVLPWSVALDYDASGVPARSCGITRDVRLEYPYAAYEKLAPKICTAEGGDVNARFQLRIQEVFESIRLIEDALAALPGGLGAH